MGRPKKITEEMKPQIAEDMSAMSRKEVCAKWGISYQMLSREFGFAWKRGPRVDDTTAETGTQTESQEDTQAEPA